MPHKAKKYTPDLFEYKITFKKDQHLTTTQRHYLAHNARDALGMFAYGLIKSLFKHQDYQTREFLIAKEFVKLHDKTLQSPKFQLEEVDFQTDKPKGPSTAGSINDITSHSVLTLVEEMNQRIELIKLEEFNRWANQWYSLKLPLEEVV